MKLSSAVRAVAAGLCAGFILVLVACGGSGSGGGSSFSSGGGTQAPPLVITTTSLPQGITGVLYQQTMSASGGTPPYTWLQDGNLPSGLTLNPSTGMITGTMTGAVFGPVQFTVSDSGNPRQTATQTISITVIGQLSFVTTSLPAAHANAPYDAVISLSANADSTTWKLLSGTLPSGMQLSNPAAQQIEITGTTTQTGSYPITLQVQDTSTPPQVAQQNFTLTVDNALTIVSSKLGSAIINSHYSATVLAVNGTPPFQWSAGGLPAALAIDPNTGTISGAPSVYGVFQPTVTVTDAAAHSASQVLGLTVVSALTVSMSGNLSAVNNKPFFTVLSAYGGSPPYTWSVVSGSLPAGLSLSGASGTISGTPTQLGSSNVTFRVTDAGTPQQSAQWSTTLAVVTPTLLVSSFLPQNFPLGVPVTWTAAAIGGTPPYHWSFLSGTLPPGLNFDANTAELTGTPTALGPYTFALQATDSGTPQQTSASGYSVKVTTPLGRNDTVAHATPLTDGSWLASIGPYADPPDNPAPAPDTDYYKISGLAGSMVVIAISAQASFANNPLDPVLEIVDANGVRFSSCQQPGDTSNTYTSNCLNDDIVPGVNRDSQLVIKVPGSPNSEVALYAHVFDWRGDARPDMQYYINVSGSIAPLQVFPPTPPGCLVAQTCNVAFFANGGLGPLTWSVVSGNIPPGMTLGPSSPSTAALAGTPTAIGRYSFVARATDASSPPQKVDVPFTLTVENPPTITNTSLPNATAGQFYSVTLNATGGTPPYQWGAGANADNFTLQMNSSTGVLSGVPRTAGTFTLGISAIDAVGIASSKSLSLIIQPGPLTFTAGTYPNGKVGVQYVDMTPIQNANGGTPLINITMIGGTLPPGMFFDRGELYGIPTTAGTYALTFQASDSSSPPQILTATYTITINP